MDSADVIKELNNLPTTVYNGFYQLRITHDLRNRVVNLIRDQNKRIWDLLIKIEELKEVKSKNGKVDWKKLSVDDFEKHLHDET